MELEKILNARFSVRKFQQKPVEPEILEKILEAGRLAPSAVNFQPWYFIVVQQPGNLEKLHSVYPREWFKTAPAAIIFCADHSQSWKRASDGRDSADIDVAIAVDHVTLMAAEHGLGTCWVCNFDVKRCCGLFNFPANVEPIVILPLGYPDIEPPLKKRKPLSEIVFWERFGQRSPGTDI